MFTVTFSVSEQESGEDIEDAEIEVKDVNENEVDPEGYGVYELKNGFYTYKVAKEGFKEVEDSFIIAGNSINIDVKLEEENLP